MPDLSGFETFTKQMTPLGKKPYVTVQKRGLLSFNKAAYAALGEPKAVELLYNKAAQVIAIRAVAEDVTHGFPFRSLGGAKNTTAPTTFLVGATAFMNFYDIPTEISTRREVEVEDQVILLDLKTEGVVVALNRRSKETTSDDAGAGAAAKDAEPDDPTATKSATK